MAIQHRRGADKDFDPQKMLPGEFAVTTDGTRKVYVAFAAGDVEELSTEETDTSLTKEGKAADAKATGDKIRELDNYIDKQYSDIKENVIDVVYEYRKIMFSSAGITNGYYVDATNGVLKYNSDFSATDYIDLTNIKKFKAIGIQQSAYYDENKTYLASLGVTGTITTETEYTVPEGAKYIRFSVYNQYKDSAYCVVQAYRFAGANAISKLNSDIEDLTFNIKENVIDVVYEYRKIMFSSAGITNGYYVDATNGVLKYNSDFSATDYIDVSSIETFRAYGIQQSAFYDGNKKYVKSLGVTGTITTETEYTVPEGAKYIRFSVYNQYKDSAYCIIPAYRNVKLKTSDLVNDAGFITEDFISKEYKCMFSSAGITNGYYVNATNGTLGSSPDFSATDYINLTDAKKFKALGIQQSAFYDENKRYLASLGVTGTITTETEYAVPEGAKYIRFSVYNKYKDTGYYTIPGFIINNFKLSDFENDANISPVFYIGANREYKTLRSGITKAITKRNSIVYVDDGVYDLCEEFKTEIENNYSSQYGIRLANNVHVIFSSGAKVKAICNQVSNNIEVYFAPFYCDKDSDFILENLDIESKNTRYCIHDECGGETGNFTHKYINCKMIHDNTDSYSSRFPQCIGGGLGQYMYIDIVGCYFKSKICESLKKPLVSYHNNADSNSKSNINVHNCYFDDLGTFRVTHYGSSTDVSEAIINNCSLGNEPYIEHEDGSTGNENMKLISYMNEIRSQ